MTGVKNTVLRAGKIRASLDEIAKSSNRPDVVIIANALSATDSTSFRKYFVETVAEGGTQRKRAHTEGLLEKEIRHSEKQKERCFAGGLEALEEI